MFQIFRNAATSAGRQKKASPAIELADTNADFDAADDASLRLQRELAVLLARKPKHRKKPATANVDHDDEAPMLLFDDSDGELPAKAAETATPAMSAEQAAGQEPEPASASRPPTVKTSATGTRDRWMQSTRRSRRSNLFRKTASVIITLAVTAFIISIVAAILFGLPDSFTHLVASNARTAAIPVNVDAAIASELARDRLR